MSDTQTPAEPVEALVIGGGPAGLMAAEELARAGAQVVLCEGKPSAGRKFLMAGKSGLNLTMDQPVDPFRTAFAEAQGWLAPILADFGPKQVQAWARGLGQEVFTGTSGRVFPAAMKASPLLRAWLARIDGVGVERRMRWRWEGWSAGGALRFATPGGRRYLTPGVCVLALGGASWARLGSDGTWAPLLAERGVDLAPFQPANMAVRVRWSDHMEPHFGAPLKGIALMAGERRVRAECVLSADGLEGGGIYALSRELRAGAALVLDLFPELDVAQLTARLALRPSRESGANRLRKALRLRGARLALVHEALRPLPREPERLAAQLKALNLPVCGVAEMDGAISTAGGVRQAAVDEGLMLRALPGVFVAGEMLDWEAPTGGYLITGCLATGRHAGRAAANWRATQLAGSDEVPH